MYPLHESVTNPPKGGFRSLRNALFFKEGLVVIVDEGGSIPGTGLFEDVFAVGAYRFETDKELFGYLLVGESLHDEAQYLDFPYTELLVGDLYLCVLFFLNGKSGSREVIHVDVDGDIDLLGKPSYQEQQILDPCQ